MRLIDADMLEQEVIKRAFEGKLEWNVNDLKQLIRKQPIVKDWELASECGQRGMKLKGGW